MQRNTESIAKCACQVRLAERCSGGKVCKPQRRRQILLDEIDQCSQLTWRQAFTIWRSTAGQCRVPRYDARYHCVNENLAVEFIAGQPARKGIG
jgi:hypothetical protein